MNEQVAPSGRRFWRADLVYVLLLFAAATTAVVYAISTRGFLSGDYGLVTAGFFVLFGLFTIATGFPHPGFGHVSFDRVAQVASILVLGPVDAAWINGLASFIYPWHRLAYDVPFRRVLVASLNNSGLMTIIILGCGLLYESLGGPVALRSLNLQSAGLVLLLALSMQFTNDLGMMVMFYLRKLNPRSLFNTFATAVELYSVLLAVIVAIAMTTRSALYVALLLIALAIGILVLRQYALMRSRLETLVEERTEELRVQAIEFERQATHDKLTGLPNRRFADNYLEGALELADRNGECLTVAFADIDHFKQINDRHSHAVGDEVLRRVATVISDRCRKSDVVARYGGEEFLLCFPGTDIDFAEQVCNQIRLAIEQAEWPRLQDMTEERIHVTISIGLSQSGNGLRLAGILREADARLYQAKSEGRNRVVA